MQVEMNGGVIVIIALILIGMIGTGLVIYYIRKAQEERAQQANPENDASANIPPRADTDN